MNSKILFSFIVTILLVIIIGLFSINKMLTLSNLTQKLYDHPFTVTNAIKNIQSGFISMHRYMKDVVISNTQEELQEAIVKVNRAQKNVYEQFDIVFKKYLGPKEDIQESFDTFVRWKPIRDKVITLMKQNKRAQAQKITKDKGFKHITILNNQVNILINYAQKKAEYFLSHTIESKNNAIFFTVTLLGGILLMIVIILLILMKKLSLIERDRTIMLQQSRTSAMGDMIGNISHQWRQPLNALGLILQKINLYQHRGKLNSDLLQESIQKCMELIQNMSTTIDDFRDFFKPNKNKSDFLILKAVNSASSIISSTLKHHSITYTIDIDDESLEIHGYMNEFSQVLINLLNNAKDALIGKRINPAKITLTVRKIDKNIQITVSDNAGGIPQDQETMIFDPYFSTKEEGKGTGIGLYMSKIIIEEHMNGQLTVSNTDEGACFTISLKCS